MTADLRPGVFLMAYPALPDPNFEGTVVLLCAHSEEGSLGVVLNRPTEISVPSLLDSDHHFQGLEQNVYWGGPVGLNRLNVLHGGSATVTDSLEVCPGVAFGGEIDSLQDGWKSGLPLRFYLGYSGWESGQLEGEIAADVWRVLPASAPLVFEQDPTRLWQMLTAEQDQHYSWMKNLPDHPADN